MKGSMAGYSLIPDTFGTSVDSGLAFAAFSGGYVVMDQPTGLRILAFTESKIQAPVTRSIRLNINIQSPQPIHLPTPQPLSLHPSSLNLLHHPHQPTPLFFTKHPPHRRPHPLPRHPHPASLPITDPTHKQRISRGDLLFLLLGRGFVAVFLCRDLGGGDLAASFGGLLFEEPVDGVHLESGEGDVSVWGERGGGKGVMGYGEGEERGVWVGGGDRGRKG